MPPDDNVYAKFRRSPAVLYNLIDPAGDPIYTNDNPSGTEEWEQFTLTTDPAYENPDMLVERIQPGFYAIQVLGLDLHNLAFLRTDKEVCDIDSGCGPCVWPGCNATDSCPRTIGYWKNNVKKVFGGKNKGVQESAETLDWALKAVALQSPIYRSGLVSSLSDPNATTVAPIGDPQPLTSDEANAILQKKTKLGNSMLGRALQQNLATWMNMASGKISDANIVTIEKDGNVIFEGTMMEALLEAQNIMLNGGDIERAKDIADMINNGQITSEDSDTENVDASGNVNCSIYGTSMKQEKQPKKYDELPKAPKPQDVPNPEPEPMPDPETCGAIENTYTVENPTENPFYSIKFNFASGTEVKDSNYDEFSYTIPYDQAAAMTSMQLEAKAGQDQGIVTLDTCSFAEGLPCGPVQTEDHLFAFTFMGATDNGDGTVTLTFQVQNYSNHGLSHASFGLPDGVVPTTPEGGNYTSRVCPE